MSRKIHLNRYLALLLLFTLGAGVFFYKVNRADTPGTNMEAWVDVHKTRVEGQCVDCHSSLDETKNKAVPGKTRMIPPPKSHTEQFVRFTHGKDDRRGSHSCSSCHQTQECVACHSVLPESHTSDFQNPVTQTTGAERHAALGRADLTACYTCHRNLNEDCKACHKQDEIIQWQEKSSQEVKRWKSMLNLR